MEPMVDPVLLVALEIGSAVTADVAVEIASAVPEAVVAEDSVFLLYLLLLLLLLKLQLL